MKIVATVTDANGVVHAGSSTESRSAIIEIKFDDLPPVVRHYLNDRKITMDKGQHFYQYLTFSILEEK